MSRALLAMANIGPSNRIRELVSQQGWVVLPDEIDKVRGRVAYLQTADDTRDVKALAADVRTAVKEALKNGARKLFVHAYSDTMTPEALEAFWVGMGFRYLADDRDGRPIYVRNAPSAKHAKAAPAKANGRAAASAPSAPTATELRARLKSYDASTEGTASQLRARLRALDEFSARIETRAKRRILADYARGRIKTADRSFADLHAHVDANTYLLDDKGHYDARVSAMSVKGAGAFLGDIIHRLDAWLRAGALTPRAKANGGARKAPQRPARRPQGRPAASARRAR